MSRRSSGVDEFHDTVEGSPKPGPSIMKTKAKTAPKKGKQTAPIVFRGPDFDSTDINSCVALLNYLADSITSAVQEGKSVTSGNKSLIVAAALEIKELIKSLPILVAAPPTPPAVVLPSPQRNSEVDIKVEVIAAIRSELNKIKRDTEDIKEIVTDLQNKPQPTVATNPQVTYAAALTKNKDTPIPSFPILVESTDPTQTSDDIIESVKTSVNVIKLGVGISNIRPARNSKVLVTCTDPDSRETLKKALNEKNNQLTVGEPTKRYPLLRLIGVDKDMSDAEIEEAIYTQNKAQLHPGMYDPQTPRYLVRRRTKPKWGVCNVTVQCVTEVWRALVDTRIRVGYNIVTVINQSLLLQCYNCQSYGHRAQDCTNSVCCGYCAQPHDSRECINHNREPTCCNCTKVNKEANHPAYSQKCPEWQQWDRSSRVGINY